MPEQPGSPFPPLQTDLKIHSCLMSGLRLPRTHILTDFNESRHKNPLLFLFLLFLSLKTKGYTKAPPGKSADIEGISQTKGSTSFFKLFQNSVLAPKSRLSVD